MSMRHHELVPDWTAEGTRPAGQPGTVGRDHGANAAWSYPAVQIADGRVLFWRDSEREAGHWIVAPRLLAGTFEPGEEWQADCPHLNRVPWSPCDSEADCAALRREAGEW